MSGRGVEVSVRIAAGIVAAGRALGVEVGPALAAAGLDPACLSDPDARIPAEREEALWEEMALRSGDPFFGLHAQRHIPAGAYDVLDYAVRSSADLRHAFENLIRYNRLVHDAATFELREGAGEARLTQRFLGDPRGATWQVTDYSLGGLVIVSRAITGVDWVPREVRMTHGPPEDSGAYRELFGVTPRFDCEANELCFDAAVLDLPVRGADPRLHELLRRHADALLERLPRREGLVEQVREILAKRLCGGDSGVGAVAREMGTTPRTLQRRLAREGSSHQELRESMRRELAIRLLEEGRVGIAEVAYLLGYSEPSAFHRAFKRWTGHTPARHPRQSPTTQTGDGPQRKQ